MTLRVTFEVVPYGDEARAYKLGQLDISNWGHVDDNICEYSAALVEPSWDRPRHDRDVVKANPENPHSAFRHDRRDGYLLCASKGIAAILRALATNPDTPARPPVVR